MTANWWFFCNGRRFSTIYEEYGCQSNWISFKINICVKIEKQVPRFMRFLKRVDKVSSEGGWQSQISVISSVISRPQTGKSY